MNKIYSQQLDFRQGVGRNEHRSVQAVHEDANKTDNTAENSSAKSIMNTIVLLPVYFYRYTIKYFLPMSCRFEPTCSEYAIQTVQTLGPIKGIGKAFLRVLRCNPWCEGGHDPVHRI